MRPILFVRGAAVVAALSAATFVSFPSFPSTRLFTLNKPTVDRTFKGDRLPMPVGANKMEEAPASPTRQTREKVPLGCGGAFSPISSPLLAQVFRRCAV
jgi:hypothetical protein